MAVQRVRFDRTVLWASLVDDLYHVLEPGDTDWVFDPTVGPSGYPVGASSRTVAAAQLFRSFLKKYEDEVDLSVTAIPALALFRQMNERCEKWNTSCTELFGPYDEVILGEFKNTLWQFFTVEGFPLLSLAGILPFCDFGPGSAPGLRDRLSFADKIGHTSLTASNQLVVDLYYEWVKDSELRVDCEIARLQRFGAPEIVQATSMTPVPKTEKIARLVKTEPSLNMFFQKGIQAVLEKRLRTFFGIDLSTQPSFNSRLARIGSCTGDYGTIDLKSASDTISMKFCKEYLPKEVLSFLGLFRSTHALVEGQMTELHMMATMGNAFCFPLQTIIFASLVVAVYRAMGIPCQHNRLSTVFEEGGLSTRRFLANWGVFGDDIIVHKEAYPVMIRVLKALGFIPNEDKSYGEQFVTFRESCGSDYWAGEDVRGVYIRTLKTSQDWCSLFNRLTIWSAKHKISLKKVLCLAKTYLADAPPVPPWDTEDAGIRLPSSRIYTGTVLLRNTPKRDPYGSILYRRYESKPRIFRVDSESRPCWKYWNSSALLLAAIKGTLAGGRVTLRQRSPVYHTKLGVAPCWDYFPSEAGYDPVLAMRWINLMESLFD